VNRAQLDARQRALEAEAPIRAKRIKAANIKSWAGSDSRRGDYERWKAEDQLLKRTRKQSEGTEAVMAKHAHMGNSLGNEPEGQINTKMVNRGGGWRHRNRCSPSGAVLSTN